MSLSGEGSAGSFRKKGRILHVGRLGIPGVTAAFGHRQFLPDRVAVEDRGVLLLEKRRLEGLCHRVVHFGRSRPDIAQEDRLPVLAGSQRLLLQIDVHSPCQRKGYHQ
jgi:hypothetical protein